MFDEINDIARIPTELSTMDYESEVINDISPSDNVLIAVRALLGFQNFPNKEDKGIQVYSGDLKLPHLIKADDF